MPLQNRWRTILGGSWKRPITKAIREHGFDAFTTEIIEECSDSERYDRVAYWIRTLNTMVPNGLNKHEIDEAGKAKDLSRRKP